MVGAISDLQRMGDIARVSEEGPLKPEVEAVGMASVTWVAARIHQLEREFDLIDKNDKHLLASSVLSVADAAKVNLFPLLHEAPLQPVPPPSHQLSPPAPPSPLQPAPHHLEQVEANHYGVCRVDEGEAIMLLNTSKVSG